MNKKGASSLEFILAFVLFAGFTITAIYFFNPVSNLKNMDYSRDYTFGKIVENTSIKLESYSIVVNNSFTDPKIKFTLSGIDPIKKVYSTDYNGTFMNSSRTGDEIFCVNMKTQRFFEMYLSEDIPLPATGTAVCKGTAICEPNDSWCCNLCLLAGHTGPSAYHPDTGCGVDVCVGISKNAISPNDYQISSTSTQKVISESRIIDIINRYNNYIELKQQLAIPADIDFSFSLKFADGTTRETIGPTTVRGEIYTETKRMEVLRTTGVPEFGQFTVSVW